MSASKPVNNDKVGVELLSRYELVGRIGEGTYGKVYKALKHDQSRDMFYAIKMIKRSPKGKDTVTSLATLREIKLLRELKHPNVVNLTDVIVDPVERDVALVMDFASWTLESVIEYHRAKQTRIPDKSLKSMIYQCLKGLEFLHQNWVLHRDLKPQNILLIGDGPKRGTLQLADLGLARIFQSPTRALARVDKVVVTLWYRSPELLLGAMHYTTAVDIWSLGCIFMELFMCHHMNGDSTKGQLRAPRALFQGIQQQKQGSFEENQVFKILQFMKMPDNSTWPDVEKLPHYKDMIALAKKHEAQLATKKDFGIYFQDDHQKAGRELIERMLEMNPEKRYSATDALTNDNYLSTLQTESYFKTNCLDNPKDRLQNLEYDRPRPKPLEPNIDIAQKEYTKSRNMSKTTPHHKTKKAKFS